MLRPMFMLRALGLPLVTLAIAACGTGEQVAGPRSGPIPASGASPLTSEAPAQACADGTQPAALPSPPPAASPPPGSGTTNEVDVEIYADCTSVRVGQPVRLRIIASGSHHGPSISGVHIEGTTTSSDFGCVPEDSNEQPSPAVTVQDVEHTYKKAGKDRVVVNAATVCSRLSGFGRSVLVLDVRP